MISEKDKKVILDLAKEYNVQRIILFGSSSKDNIKSRDIDLAVEGIPDRLFFKFYSELIFNLSQPVDLIDLSKKNKFTEIVSSEGIQLYGQSKR
ncbi:MAG TPA: nucleotidyltransferase domain-containing protein [Caldithrix abyssi]|uniref:Nucleotidyltransferase domain-containing protein n=1 Tax=Caldithrix abyssi TaxID=187145 RepID=A0A7V1PUU3_CALAY|nr:nucleotidyltransferase domain-containing protein [Caldithrix abyssi]